mmetsp:Transcript_36465/g.77556  ORF Transcript_36465/g.77556 Transcript_36465/m.77556 type:complete len:465 (+) Transcript_36465:3-1397(+)|eukprot:CAMPEP_0206541782 /NCGR_PEP_ID=MMETSP0325_2-20121206/9806_1 /ASSEMBLY_ACC=CAM_ASM_000347 /TAXON_ID=2866 /ORGANISM="Crypthecodinium cohnii, Strain Seligo" /LENGTH=464 /DNA_ID=CAMNT_0054039763 /DNA_START=32 /DNA_END=1426 /DNA_ORIENTATION=+
MMVAGGAHRVFAPCRHRLAQGLAASRSRVQLLVPLELGAAQGRSGQFVVAAGRRAFHGHSHGDGDNGHGNAHGDYKENQNPVVLSKRLPEDYVQNTLMPHLESQLLDSIQAYTPAELAKIARIYAKQEVKQRALCQKLSDTVKFRMKGFEAVDIVDILGAMYVLVPDDDELWEMLEARILLRIDDFTALNFMGIIRIYNKRHEKHNELLAEIVPRLRELLGQYEAIELSEMLVSMAQSAEAAADMDILGTLVPEIERRYNEVSLVHSINNIWALSQLKIRHEGLLTRVAEDLKNPTKSKDLPPVYMAKIAWIYRRCNAWDMVSESMLPLIKGSVAEFRCAEFARLAQALPEQQAMLRQIADLLALTMAEMGRKDFLLFFVGCVHGELLKVPMPGQSECSLTEALLNYAKEEQDNFKRDEVQKLVFMLYHAQSYRPLLDRFPASWNVTKEETIDYIKAKGKTWGK